MPFTFGGNKMVKLCKTHGYLFFVLMFVCLLAIPAQGRAQFKEKVRDLLNNHERVWAAKHTIESLEEAVSVSKKDWFPNLGVTGNLGKEDRNNPNVTADTDFTAKELSLTLTQPIFDYGARNKRIDIATLGVTQARQTLELTKQSLLLEAITAQTGLITAYKNWKSAKLSVQNIKRQTQLESAKVKKGAGFSTDVLQAKVQLAGAEARYIQAFGALKTARNRFKALFGEVPFDESALTDIELPVEILPSKIDIAVEMALENNLQLASLKTGKYIAKSAIQQTKAEQFFPNIDFVAEQKYKTNVGGTQGYAKETNVKLQLTYNFNLGLSSLNNYNAAKSNYKAADRQFYDAKKLVIEAVSNSYDQYVTQRKSAEMLKSQAEISQAFLNLARKERKLGKRSLIDILAGETALINAKSDAETAKGQLVLSAYNVLSVIGILTLEKVKISNKK